MAYRTLMLWRTIARQCIAKENCKIAKFSSQNETGFSEQNQQPRPANEMKNPAYQTVEIEIPKLTNTSQFYKLAEYRHIYPEFLPDPDLSIRHFVRERLERGDMMARRKQIEIPEFYVGSIMSVTASDPFAPGKCNRFVGICLSRQGQGTRSFFILRNVVDRQGIEIRYDIYNPCIQKIQVLRLEKRLDEHLMYLRDALPEYSTIPFDMDPEPTPEGGLVPVNTTKVIMKPRPWWQRWERYILNGVDQDSIMKELSPKMVKQIETRGESAMSYLKYDLMKEYREVTHEDDQALIWKEVSEHHAEIQGVRRRERRKQLLDKKKK